jgi:tetratricopeptide (TPR) repeat protein
MTDGNDLYQEILDYGPSSDTLFVVLSKLKQEGQWKRVVQECIKALNRYPRDMAIRQILAEAYTETGFLSQAEAEWEKVTAQIDELASVYKRLATLYAKGKRDEEARKVLQVYLAHRPDDAEARQLLEGLKPLPEPEPVEIEPPVEPPSPVGEEAAPQTYEEDREEPGDIAPPSEQGSLPEIATPTLAELYYTQGQVDEAIRTYEKVVAENPGDERAEARLEELRAAPPPKGTVQRNKEREKKEKMIALLEKWLANIQEEPKDTMPA